MINRIHMLGTPVNNLSLKETLDLIDEAIITEQHIHHTVVNAGKIVAMHENPELKESVINADIINADGQAVVWASRIFGIPLKERVTGIDLMENLVDMAFRKKYRIFLFGAKEDVLMKIVDKYSRQYSPLLIAG